MQKAINTDANTILFSILWLLKSSSADISSMTVAQLKAVAKEKGIKGYTSMKKADLLAALS